MPSTLQGWQHITTHAAHLLMCGSLSPCRCRTFWQHCWSLREAVYKVCFKFVQLMQGLYSDKDLAKALELAEVIDFHQTLDIDGIKASKVVPPLDSAPPVACGTSETVHMCALLY